LKAGVSVHSVTCLIGLLPMGDQEAESFRIMLEYMTLLTECKWTVLCIHSSYQKQYANVAAMMSNLQGMTWSIMTNASTDDLYSLMEIKKWMVENMERN
jgi:hypothetical protein